MRQKLTRWAEHKGNKIAFADISLLEKVKETLDRRRDDGEFAPGFFEENLDFFTYLEGSTLRRPKSLLLVAVMAPAWVLRFTLEGETVDTILPPTYVQYRPLFEKIRNEIARDILGEAAGIEILQAPLKSLAVSMGLAVYGRNNVTYIPAFGSYFQLVGYILDIPLAGKTDEVRIDRKLDLCASCRACLKACPTGAIIEDRFLIHAEKCYTLFSESRRPIPEALRPPSPDCLIGCLKCQVVCPANKGLLRRETADVFFTFEETAALDGLKAIGDKRLDEIIHAKFETLALSESIPIFRRNLRRLLEIRSADRKSGNRTG